MSGSSVSPGAFNIGSDTKINVLIAGVVTAFQYLTQFESRQITEKVTSQGVDGVSRLRDVEMSWEGTLEYDRSDATIDEFFALKELARYAGGLVPDIQIVETVTNVDQSISKFQYTGVTMTLETTGARTGANKISPRVNWRASTRIVVS